MQPFEKQQETVRVDARITEISYGMTVNIGNYEAVRFDLKAEVTADDDWRDVLESLRRKSRKMRTRIIEEGD